MKVVHVPFTFAPDPVGGTEIYVETLCHELRAHQIETLIVAPSSKGADEAYEHNGLRVYRFASKPNIVLNELYGDGDPNCAAAFAKILDEERPDAIHMHALTSAVSILFVRAAKQRGLPVFFTYHTPTISCQRGDLILRNNEICDGRLDVARCTGCYAESLGVPHWASGFLSHVPVSFARVFNNMNLRGTWIALQLSELVRKRQAAFQQLMQDVDAVVAPSDWVSTLLLRNGVPYTKIILSRHGLPHFQDSGERRIEPNSVPLRVAFLGRIDGKKGSDTLIEAMKLIRGLSVELHFYGVMQSISDRNILDSIRDNNADARIYFFDPVPHAKVVSVLKNYHVLAVPSKIVETGPLVVLEALAAGTPIIGSNIGGISEWIRHEENGILVDFRDVQGWADALSRCAGDRRFLERLRQGIKVVRSMEEVAREMAQLYCKQLMPPDHCHPTRVTA